LALASFPEGISTVYLPKGNLVLFADRLKGAGDTKRVAALVYDFAKNRFRGLLLAADPGRDGQPAYGGNGTGLVYDPVRDLAWTVNSAWQLRVMRLAPATAEFADTED